MLWREPLCASKLKENPNLLSVPIIVVRFAEERELSIGGFGCADFVCGTWR
jgi:hypothetical protein